MKSLNHNLASTSYFELNEYRNLYSQEYGLESYSCKFENAEDSYDGPICVSIRQFTVISSEEQKDKIV